MANYFILNSAENHTFSKYCINRNGLITSGGLLSNYVLFVRSCFQISEGSLDRVQEFLEEFLNKWSFVDERYYVLVGAETNVDYVKGCDGCFVLGVDKYLEVVEVYVMKLLIATLNNVDLAISWVEKAELPEGGRQVK